MPANYNGLKNNVQNYLEGQGAANTSEAAQYFADQCMSQVLTKVNPSANGVNTVLPANNATIKGAFDAAFNACNIPKNGDLANNIGIWTTVASTWGTAVSFPAWAEAPPLFTYATIGAAGVPAGGALLYEAFGPNAKSAGVVAGKFKDAIKAVMDGVTYTKTNINTLATAPGTGLS